MVNPNHITIKIHSEKTLLRSFLTTLCFAGDFGVRLQIQALVHGINNMTNRIESLDWLRGVMALAIMFYHLTYWHYFPLDSSFFLGRLGVYGVSIFFVLSGLSMAIVYSKFIVDRKTIVAFYVRRIFRIWPLLWLCVALVTISTLAKGGEVSLEKILLNLTTLFGFVSPGSYINTGAWSIGNEMVYYAFTPIIIMAYEKHRFIGNALLLVSFAMTLIFSFYLLSPEMPLKEQWLTYINPFNNLFLYVAGVAIYYNLSSVKIGLSGVLLLFGIATATFVFYPVYGDKIAIVTGENRLVFLFASILMVVSFYKFTGYDLVPRGVQYPLEQFGIATYGVYLLHPVVNSYAGFALRKVGLESPALLFAVVVVLTIITAIVSFNIFEKRIMRIGKRVTSVNSGLVASRENTSLTRP